LITDAANTVEIVLRARLRIFVTLIAAAWPLAGDRLLPYIFYSVSISPTIIRRVDGAGFYFQTRRPGVRL
jgi:hypothetical protein